MNILIVSTSDIYGGAALAAFRLMRALNSGGENVKMLVRDKRSNDPDVFVVGNQLKSRWNFYFERGAIFLQNRFSKENLFDVSIANTGCSITELPLFREADVIHLHWINQGMLSVNEIEKIIASGKKVVWTMHDMWPFTGICHHAVTCINYERSCGLCPYLVSASPEDLSHSIFLKKQAIYGNGKITFVACSNWLKELAIRSPLTQRHTVVSIPNPINTNEYCQKNKFEALKRLNLPVDRKIVLFAAVKASDPRKGIHCLLEASRILAKNHNNILFIIAGGNGEELEEKLSLPAIDMGLIPPNKMVDAYNAADLFVTPSLQENLPNTLMEAMACGTPCVGFNTGGIPEMILHGENGYVAKYKDAGDLANGILWTLYKADYATLSSNARKKALKDYNESLIAQQYIDIYHA